MSLPRYPTYKDSGVSWLGEVPAHWDVDRIKASVATCRNGIWGDEAQGDLNDIPCVRVADFDRVRFCVKDDIPTIRSVTDKERQGRLLQQGDLLLEKSGGGDLQPVGQVVEYRHSTPAVCSNFVARMSLREGMVSGYWVYFHAAAYAVGLNIGSINQTSGIQNLDQDRYFNERAPFPPAVEQTAIFRFLDRETAKIDALIAEQEKLIALLAEKRQATISRAVTRGLDPSVPLKDSGVPWLGKVPAHWSVTRIKAVSEFTTSGPRGWSEFIADQGSLFIQSGDLDDNLGIDFDSAKRVSVVEDADALRTRLKTGDVVVCITGAKTGNVAVCRDLAEVANVNQHLCLIRPVETVNSHFLAVALKGYIGKVQFEIYQYGLKQGLSLENVRELVLVLPPRAEQDVIVEFIDREKNQLTDLILTAENAIDLLKERRAALISAAVTGKIDVRGLAA